MRGSLPPSYLWLQETLLNQYPLFLASACEVRFADITADLLEPRFSGGAQRAQHGPGDGYFGN